MAHGARLEALAEKSRKFALNVDGAFYVDDSCIDCDVCRVTAPDSFTANEDAGHSYVYRQPRTPEERAHCLEALEECPVDAIGRDGESHEATSATARS